MREPAYGPSPTKSSSQASLHEPQYLTPAELAKVVNVKSVKTVLRWALADPTMPCLRYGGVVRFPCERVLTWLRTREQGPIARPRSKKRTLLSANQAQDNGSALA